MLKNRRDVLTYMSKGLFHIYCGDGKGKTTAAVGLAVRAAGSGMKVLFAQFMKDGKSSELNTLAKIENIDLFHAPCTDRFIRAMSEDERTNFRIKVNEAFSELCARMNSGLYDLVVIDECCSAITTGMLDIKNVTDAFRNRRQDVELIITGRNPDKALIDMADYVSEICKRKHPFDQGIRAREGIEK